MTEESKRSTLPPASFATFIQGLASQCLIALGDAKNPFTGKQEKDLAQAKYSIDLLQVLEEKTKGNLTEDEATLLNGLLYQMRMRYVQICNDEPQA